ncbi:MAG: DUF2905 domain-containing protein [Nitrospira sp.]|nr:DUF2905 domain-containing protein [Nitrospira sp.]MBS0155794.1 DUF2905 domain-containing protein [Nitrospira sp.]MBS0164585.1 DUF2905 domain-containing protein [Nitrospira sp.]
MPEWTTIGKIFIGVGLGIVALGVLLIALDRIPGLGSSLSWLGKLPGDISIKRENVSFYFPVATSILLSVLLSLIFYIVGWLFRR